VLATNLTLFSRLLQFPIPLGLDLLLTTGEHHDLGLVSAKEWGDLHGREDSLGLPPQSNNLGQREFARILKAAKVRRITIHGLRYASATLLLKAGGSCARRATAAWTQTRRNHIGHLLCARPAVEAAGRGPPAGCAFHAS
jgi:integrase